MIKEVQTEADILECFPVMQELRPHLNKDEFVTQVNVMFNEGFQMAACVHDERVVAVAGYRMFHNFHLDKKIYIDDLITKSSERSKGYSTELLTYIEIKAQKSGCKYVHLDSGTQRTRAHKFYFNLRYEIASFHFVKKIQ